MDSILLDTNALPQEGQLHSIILSAILRVAAVKQINVYLPRIVLEESVSARRRRAQAAFSALQSANQEAGKYFPVEPVYLPSEDELAAMWERQLRKEFKIIETTGEDALDALVREAHRRKPAKVDGTGSRDSAIWLTVVRHHIANNGTTYFVSNNSSDFSSGKSKRELHPDLKKDLGDSVNTFRLYNQLYEVLSDLTESAEVELHESEIAGFEEHFTEISSKYIEEKLGPAAEGLVGLVLDVTGLSIKQVKKTYKVDDTYLVMADVQVTVSRPSAQYDPLEEEMRFELLTRTWFGISASNRLITEVFPERILRELADEG